MRIRTLQLILISGTLLLARNAAAQEDKNNRNTPPEQQSDYTLFRPSRTQEPVSLQALEDFAAGSRPVVQFPETGEVNWTQQFILARGSAIINNDRFKNASEARSNAIIEAIAAARRNLLSTINEVNVVGEFKVKDFMSESDYIHTKISGLVKGAEFVSESEEMYGTVEVTMRVPLYGTRGLASLFYTGNVNTATRNMGITGLQPEKGATGAGIPAQLGLALKLNGKPYIPALFPLLTDETGNVLYDFSSLYDPTGNGQFPQLVQASRQAFDKAGFGNGIEQLEITAVTPGKLAVDGQGRARLVSRAKAGKVMPDIPRLLLIN